MIEDLDKEVEDEQDKNQDIDKEDNDVSVANDDSLENVDDEEEEENGRASNDELKEEEKGNLPIKLVDSFAIHLTMIIFVWHILDIDCNTSNTNNLLPLRVNKDSKIYFSSNKTCPVFYRWCF